MQQCIRRIIMTEKEFAAIKNEIEELKKKSIESNTRLELIREQWKKDYGFDDLDSAKKELEKEQEEIKLKQEKRNKLMEELEKLFNENFKDN